ncbi:DUF448 domain-containing protein [Alphaproteobacteria bacterium]|nr:DUF448 domain-containing protein [Alphaproteobacteria bacterium]
MTQHLCRVTGEPADPADMLRFVVSPDGVLTPDLAEKLPGDGIWVINRHAVVAQLEEQADWQVPEGLADRVGVLLEQRVLSLLGLARKAGRIVLGFTKVDAALKNRRVAMLLAASDGAENGRKQIAARSDARHLVVLEAFSVEQLCLAFGGANVIHAAVTDDDWAHRIQQQANRFVAYSGSQDGGNRSESE